MIIRYGKCRINSNMLPKQFIMFLLVVCEEQKLGNAVLYCNCGGRSGEIPEI